MSFKNKDLEEFIDEIPIPDEIKSKEEPVTDSDFVMNLAAYVSEKVDKNYIFVKNLLEQYYIGKIYEDNSSRRRS